MFNPYAELIRIRAEEFTRIPAALAVPRVSTWAEHNRHGEALGCFLEGPAFDRGGRLFVVDIPFGRIFRIGEDGSWHRVAEYDGWPNGLKLHRDGRAFVADHRRGIVVLDLATGSVTTVLDTYRSEGLKGVNDLHFGLDGTLYFTDQGQTGLQDPTGRVFRWDPERGGEPVPLVDTVPSPNGLVLDREERALYVAVTRANAVWRLPLTPDGGTSKVGLFLQMSGGLAGPDGLALDEEGGLVVAHVGTGVWRFDRLGRPTHVVRCPAEAPLGTNVAFGGPDRRTLYVTDSGNGTVLAARMPVPGAPMYAHT